MILTCPACATRYSADAAKFPAAGRQVRCAKCGHVWHQPGPEPEEPSLSEPSVFAPESETQPEPASEPVQEPGPEPLSRTRSFAPMSQTAEDRPARSWLPGLAIAAGWAGLIGVVLLIGLSAVRYRQEITVIWPQSAGVYSTLGMKVNAKGVDFSKVDYHRESEDGQVVLAVTGAIVNNSDRELPVPQTVRVTLSDASNHEIYHWTFTPTVRTLKAGQSIPFTTRISSPPAAARHLEVRFARDIP
jgi:predicted Zn finger-like uncharacterized protein